MRPYWRIVRAIAVVAFVLARAPFCWAQAPPPPADSSTSNDLFVMLGPDLDRPGTVARANYNIGVGHTVEFVRSTIGLLSRAQRELGSQFDIRSFHDEMLSGGVLPLDLQDARTEDWIRAQKAVPAM